MYNFYNMVVAVFGIVYLREPNAEDTAQMLSVKEARCCPWMMGSIDCMHSFFCVSGSHNDINMLQRSPVFFRLAQELGQKPYWFKWLSIQQALLSCRWHLHRVVHICEDNP
jgi:hypothetical protein